MNSFFASKRQSFGLLDPVPTSKYEGTRMNRRVTCSQLEAARRLAKADMPTARIRMPPLKIG